MIANAASTVLAAGSKPCGSPIRSMRATALPGTAAHPTSERAANGNPVQRRETLGPKEIHIVQIEDQRAATPQMPVSVVGHSVSVGCIDVAADADDGH